MLCVVSVSCVLDSEIIYRRVYRCMVLKLLKEEV